MGNKKKKANKKMARELKTQNATDNNHKIKTPTHKVEEAKKPLLLEKKLQDKAALADPPQDVSKSTPLGKLTFNPVGETMQKTEKGTMESDLHEENTKQNVEPLGAVEESENVVKENERHELYVQFLSYARQNVELFKKFHADNKTEFENLMKVMLANHSKSERMQTQEQELSELKVMKHIMKVDKISYHQFVTSYLESEDANTEYPENNACAAVIPENKDKPQDGK